MPTDPFLQNIVQSFDEDRSSGQYVMISVGGTLYHGRMISVADYFRLLGVARHETLDKRGDEVAAAQELARHREIAESSLEEFQSGAVESTAIHLNEVRVCFSHPAGFLGTSTVPSPWRFHLEHVEGFAFSAPWPP